MLIILTAEELVKFTDKQSYLDWVVAWKNFYKDLAQRQRHLRIELSKPHSTLPYYGAGYMSERLTNKLWLTILLEARQIGKRRSWEQKKQFQVQ